ncbi:helix-turn-helix transcriptional regulator [Candidatus Desantisbacteria bacterium]|nr:helix-turn-helix transcriptional regulator [Candidatus Desantisbacteria bacterium]
MKKLGINNTIRLLRVSKKYNQVKFAGLVGITQTYLSRLEKNQRVPSIGVLNKICLCLDIPIAEFYKIAEKPINTKISQSVEIISEIISILEDNLPVKIIKGLKKVQS